jgi:hypothetical protein
MTNLFCAIFEQQQSGNQDSRIFTIAKVEQLRESSNFEQTESSLSPENVWRKLSNRLADLKKVSPE